MISAYIKPTNFCNVGCDHCYLPESTRANKYIMSEDMLYRAAKLIKGLSENEGDKQTLIIWHGGEPLTLPISWFINAKNILDDVFGENNYEETIQTSLIPYTGAWSNLIHKRFNSYIGSSIDFSQRKLKGSSSEYMKLWLNKVEQARKDEILVMPSMVPTKEDVGRAKEIFEFFITNKFPRFNIDRYSNYQIQTDDWPSNMEHSLFLIELFNEVVSLAKKGITPPIINVITAALTGVIAGRPGDRWGTSCQKEFIVIEPDGSTNSCPDRISVDKPFSNVAEGTKGYTDSKERRKWIRIADISHKKSHCISCEFSTWCKSGCPITPNVSDLVNECSGYKRFLLHVKKALTDNDTKDAIYKYYLGQLSNTKKQDI